MKTRLQFSSPKFPAFFLKIILLAGINVGIFSTTTAQTMSNGTLTNICSGTFYDPGGSGGNCTINGTSGNYNNGLNITETFIPGAGNTIRFVFNPTFCLENTYDFLYIYNGNSAAAPLLGTYTGSTGPGTINSTAVDGSLTFRFTSDATINRMGWSAVISCVPKPIPVISGFSPTSGCSNTTPITINGTNLSGATAVSIGGTAVASITSNTATQIVVVPGAGTTGPITVTTPGGSVTSAATFTVSPLPLAYNVNGGGSYCSGGSGQSVGLTGSQTGINYQLYNGASPTGGAVPGTGSALDFGLQASAGTYTVIAVNSLTNCSRNQSGSVSISVNTPPSITTNPASAIRCAGSFVSFSVGATGSSLTYQWRKNSINIAGATAPVYTIASVTAADAANYDVVVSVVSCGSVTSAAATLTVNPLPGLFSVTGGGSYCNGGTGVPVGLSGSETGVNYTLTPGNIVVAGSGSAISFGNQTMASTYTVSAQNTTTNCSRMR